MLLAYAVRGGGRQPVHITLYGLSESAQAEFHSSDWRITDLECWEADFFLLSAAPEDWKALDAWQQSHPGSCPATEPAPCRTRGIPDQAAEPGS